MSAPPSFGAALVGFAAACFLCGCMLVQVYIYIKSEAARNDSVQFKSLVALIWLIDTVQLFILGCYIYGDLVVHYGNPSYLGRGPWTFAVVTGLSVWVSTPVQLFYAWRVYILGGHRNVILPLGIAIISLLGYSCGIATAIFAWKVGAFDRYDSFSQVVDTWLVADIITDILIVSSLYYFLNRGRTGFTRTDMVIDKLVFLVVGTGLAPTLMEVAHLVSFSVAPANFAHLTFNFIIPKLYANSFMATLNARTYIFGLSNNKASSQTFTGNGSCSREQERYEMPAFAPPRIKRSREEGSDILDIKITSSQQRSNDDFLDSRETASVYSKQHLESTTYGLAT